MEKEEKFLSEGKKEGDNTNNLEANFDEKASRKKKLMMLFIIGVLVGFILKGSILKPYVIGFEDYKIKNYKSDFQLREKPEEENNIENSAEEGQVNAENIETEKANKNNEEGE